MDNTKLNPTPRRHREITPVLVLRDGDLRTDSVHELEKVRRRRDEVGGEGEEAKVQNDDEDDDRVDPVGEEGGFESAGDGVGYDAEGEEEVGRGDRDAGERRAENKIGVRGETDK